jgi:replication factor C subunit 3/5
MTLAKQQDLTGIAAMDTSTAGGAGPSKARTDPTVDLRNAPWVEKYRPRSLDDVAAHQGIIGTSA